MKQSPSMHTPTSANQETTKSYSNLYKMSYTRIQSSNQTTKRKRQDYDLMGGGDTMSKINEDGMIHDKTRNSIEGKPSKDAINDATTLSNGRQSLVSVPTNKH